MSQCRLSPCFQLHLTSRKVQHYTSARRLRRRSISLVERRRAPNGLRTVPVMHYSPSVIRVCPEQGTGVRGHSEPGRTYKLSVLMGASHADMKVGLGSWTRSHGFHRRCITASLQRPTYPRVWPFSLLPELGSLLSRLSRHRHPFVTPGVRFDSSDQGNVPSTRPQTRRTQIYPHQLRRISAS